MCVCERERDRQTDRQTDRDRQREGQRDRQRERTKGEQREIPTDIMTSQYFRHSTNFLRPHSLPYTEFRASAFNAGNLTPAPRLSSTPPPLLYLSPSPPYPPSPRPLAPHTPSPQRKEFHLNDGVWGQTNKESPAEAVHRMSVSVSVAQCLL